ncbi:MAG: transglycosylase domain-containing protein [Patescibacteria group bacterium]
MSDKKPLEVDFIVKDETQNNNPQQNLKSNSNNKKPSLFKRKGFIRLLQIVSLLALLSVLLVSFKVFSDYRSVPNIKADIEKSFNEGASVILDRNGKVIKDYKIEAKKEQVLLKDIPEILQHALIVREQERFYKDPNGIPWYNLAGAIYSCGKNVVTRNGESCRGGSGLFQQIVKNTTNKSDSTISRKYFELLQSIKASEDLSKEDILEFYFNNITFGRNSIGVQAGSKEFFGYGITEKNDKALQPHQACLLASMPNMPSNFSIAIENKLKNPEVTSPSETKQWKYLKGIIDDCLDKLSTIEIIEGKKPLLSVQDSKKYKEYDFVKYGFIEKGAFGSDEIGKYKFIVELIEDQLLTKFKEIAPDEKSLRNLLVSGSLEIKTTIDLDKQQQMESALENSKGRITYGGVNMFGSIALDTSTSEIIAMIGNLDDSKPNTITGPSAYFNPGSSSKPYYYASAFNNGFNPSTILPDVKFTDPLVQSERTNAISTRFDGPVPIRWALQSSLNTTSEESLYLSQTNKSNFASTEGISNAVAFAKGLGLKFNDTAECLSTVRVAIGNCKVGTLSHANAFATLLNNGKYNEARAILEIKKKNTDSSRSSIVYSKSNIDQLYGSVIQLNAPVARQTANVLSDYNTRRNGILANSAPFFELNGWVGDNSVTAKSGTAQVTEGNINKVGDLSAIGGSPYYTILAWTGKVNQQGGSSTHGLGDSGTTIVPIWQRMMTNLHLDKTPKGFSKEGLTLRKLDSKTGLLASESTTATKEEWLTDSQYKELENVKGTTFSEKDNIFKTRTVLSSSVTKNEFDEEVTCYIPHSLFPDRAEFNVQKNSLAGYIGSSCTSSQNTAVGQDTIITNINENALFSKDSISIQATAKPNTTPTPPTNDQPTLNPSSPVLINSIKFLMRSTNGKEYSSSTENGLPIQFPVKEVEDGKYTVYITVINSNQQKTTKVLKNIEFKKPIVTPVQPNNPSGGNNQQNDNTDRTPPNNNIPVPQDPTITPQ